MAVKRNQLIAQISVPSGTSFPLPHGKNLEAGLVYCYSGSGSLTGGSGEQMVIKPGAVALFPACSSYLLTAQEDSCVLICIFPGGLERHQLIHAVEVQNLPSSLEYLARTVEQAYEALQAEGLLEKLLGLSSFGAKNIPQCVQTARRIIETCYKEDLTLEELSARVGRSKYYLSHAFQECYHMAPGTYLISVRLSQAAELLADTDLTVREIGEQVGFSNSAYFTARFKKRFGLPPKEYRTFRRTTTPK